MIFGINFQYIEMECWPNLLLLNSYLIYIYIYIFLFIYPLMEQLTTKLRSSKAQKIANQQQSIKEAEHYILFRRTTTLNLHLTQFN